MPSTVIKHYRYDAATQELRIEFQSGSVYVYENVPPDTVKALGAAFSKGEFFGARIRNNYPFRREGTGRRAYRRATRD
jgi:lysyl-tRNA synthetase class 2